MRIVKVEPICIQVSSKTSWFFIRLATDTGIEGLGEATLFGWEPLLRIYTRMVGERLKEMELTDSTNLRHAFPDRGAGRLSDSVLSAIECALLDIRGKMLGVPIHQILGTRRSEVGLYANINRGTTDRTPNGWVRRAEQALAKGFRKIKIAPFDGVRSRPGREVDHAVLENGLARIEAVSHAIKGRGKLMVDCHWRLDRSSAELIIDEVAGMGVCWLEAPLNEAPGNWKDLQRLRQRAVERNMTLAGAELAWCDEFDDAIDLRLFDAIMPDVRWCGGLAEGVAIAHRAETAGISVAPHNSAGPVLAAASIHYGAAIGNLFDVEVQFDESPLFHDLIEDPGGLEFSPVVPAPTSPGLGLRLDWDVLKKHTLDEGKWSQITNVPGAGAFA